MTEQRTPAELRAEARRLLDEADVAEKPIAEADLKTMTPHEIVAANEAGRLTDVLRGAAPDHIDYDPHPGSASRRQGRNTQ